MIQKRTITKQAAAVLAKYGYNYKSGIFLKTKDDIAASVYLNKSSYDDSIDVIVGCGPRQHCPAWPPKGPGDLGIDIGVNKITELRDHPVFMMLSDGISPYPEELEQAFMELASWIDGTLLDAGKLRDHVLNERSFLNYRGGITLMAKEWARGEVSE